MISFQKVTKTYVIRDKEYKVLENVSFEVHPNEFVSLVGKSGAGKTTLLRILIGEERPTKGRVFFDKIEVNKLKRTELPILRRRIGMIFQDFKLLSNRSVRENIAFALEIADFPQRKINSLVDQLLSLVDMESKGGNFPSELSGGEQQRVAIARALIRQPDLLIADEPTGNLDPINSWEIIKLLLKINELKTTVILATHDKDIIDKIGKRVIVLDGGKIVRDEEKGKYSI